MTIKMQAYHTAYLEDRNHYKNHKIKQKPNQNDSKNWQAYHTAHLEAIKGFGMHGYEIDFEVLVQEYQVFIRSLFINTYPWSLRE